MGISQFRNDDGRLVGKRGVGRLLDMGPKGDVGPRNMALVPTLSASAPRKQEPEFAILAAHILVHTAANVLVGTQLPAFGTGDKHPHILKTAKSQWQSRIYNKNPQFLSYFFCTLKNKH